MLHDLHTGGFGSIETSIREVNLLDCFLAESEPRGVK